MGRHSYDNMRRCDLTTSYCRFYNIHFNRPITVPPPAIRVDPNSSSPISIDQQAANSSLVWAHSTELGHQHHETTCSLSPSSINFAEDDDECDQADIETVVDAKFISQQHGPNIAQKNILSNIVKPTVTDSSYRSNSLETESNSTNDNDNDHDEHHLDLDCLYASAGANLGQVGIDCARQNLITKAKKHLFWSNGAAKKVQIVSIEHKQVYIYALESFSEKRQIQWYYEPYKGGPAISTKTPAPIMGDGVPPPEEVWSSVARTGPKLFQSSIQTKELPHTSFVKTCHVCSGRARKRCHNCHALGYEVCYSCLGSGVTRHSSSWSSSDHHQMSSGANYSGYKHNRNLSHGGHSGYRKAFSSDLFGCEETCHHCHGGGRRRCLKCIGAGFILCEGCKGQGKLRCFLKLIIIWTNHKQESILNNTDETIIPSERFKLVTGLVLYERTAPKLKPIECSGMDPGIFNASKSLLEKHDFIHRDELMIKQRHRLSSIDVNIVRYEWRDKHGYFVIYGNEQKTYVPKFPCKNFCAII